MVERTRTAATPAIWLLGLALVLIAGCERQNSADESADPAPKASGESLVFTAIPDQDTRQLKKRFAKVSAALERALGIPVEYVPVKSYSAAVTAFVNDEVQLAWFGGLSGVQARLRQPGAQAIAQGIEDPDYYSLLIAHHDTGLEPMDTLDDSLRGRSLTFGAKGSTSGRLMPEYFFRQHYGAAPEEIFSRIGYSGDHTRSIQLVQAGAYELGVLGYTTWESEMARGTIDTGKVQVIWRSPGYPDYQWTLRGDVEQRFGEGFTARVQQALIGMTDPELLQSFPRSGFIPANNADFAPIEQIARAVGLIAERDGR